MVATGLMAESKSVGKWRMGRLSGISVRLKASVEECVRPYMPKYRTRMKYALRRSRNKEEREFLCMYLKYGLGIAVQCVLESSLCVC